MANRSVLSIRSGVQSQREASTQTGRTSTPWAGRPGRSGRGRRSHGLGVEQGCAEDVGMIAFQLGGGLGDQGEIGRVALGKAGLTDSCLSGFHYTIGGQRPDEVLIDGDAARRSAHRRRRRQGSDAQFPRHCRIQESLQGIRGRPGHQHDRSPQGGLSPFQEGPWEVNVQGNVWSPSALGSASAGR